MVVDSRPSSSIPLPPLGGRDTQHRLHGGRGIPHRIRHLEHAAVEVPDERGRAVHAACARRGIVAAWIVVNEQPSLTEVLAGAVMLAGLAIAVIVRAPWKARPLAEPAEELLVVAPPATCATRCSSSSSEHREPVFHASARTRQVQDHGVADRAGKPAAESCLRGVR